MGDRGLGMPDGSLVGPDFCLVPRWVVPCRWLLELTENLLESRLQFFFGWEDPAAWALVPTP